MFVRTLKAIAEIEDTNVIKATKGHYFVSTFIERSEKYAYIHYGSGFDRTFIDFDNVKHTLFCYEYQGFYRWYKSFFLVFDNFS